LTHTKTKPSPDPSKTRASDDWACTHEQTKIRSWCCKYLQNRNVPFTIIHWVSG